MKELPNSSECKKVGGPARHNSNCFGLSAATFEPPLSALIYPRISPPFSPVAVRKRKFSTMY